MNFWNLGPGWMSWSAVKGIMAMRWPSAQPEPRPKWKVKRLAGPVEWRPPYGIDVRDWSGCWWCHFWTPIWHEGRGPYVSIGLGWLAIYRGY